MSRVKIETLTSVHIGSGVTLQKGSDFVYGKSIEDDDIIAIVSPEKVMRLIGEDNINTWVSSIERGITIDQIVKQFAPKATLEDYAKRVIMRWCKYSDTLKEFIHDGTGKPYIPGSSLKGAIRSAVLATVADRINNKDNKISNFGKFNANRVEAEAFGGSPNESVFRFLQVGDAQFGKNYEAAVRMVNLNERKNGSYWDESKPQMIEVLTSEDIAYLEMKINLDYYEKCKRMVHVLPECMSTLPKLFDTINSHTLSLLNSDIAYWEERLDAPNADSVDDYIDKVRAIKDKAEECARLNGKSCVLRLGHGSGWRFITGAWTEQLNNFDAVINASRPKNHKYSEYDFPKTRRVDDECELLGFVRLTIV